MQTNQQKYSPSVNILYFLSTRRNASMYFVMKVEGHDSFEHIHCAPRRTLCSKCVIHLSKRRKNISNILTWDKSESSRILASIVWVAMISIAKAIRTAAVNKQLLIDDIVLREMFTDSNKECHDRTKFTNSLFGTVVFSIIRHKEKPTRNYDRGSRSMRALLHSNFDRSKTRNWDCFQESAT